MSRSRTVVLVVLAAVAVLGVGGVATGLWSVLWGESPRIESMAELVPWEEAIVVPTVAPRATPTPEAFDLRRHSTTDPASPWVVVNKQHPIDRAYVPADLVAVGDAQVRAVVEPDLRAMIDAAKAEGVSIITSSGYRSYEDQTAARRSIEARRGFAHAERYSARPGFSEHQTGLALDVDSGSQPSCNYQTCFARTAEGVWLTEHAADFGFVVRYTDANTAVTGYAPEGWHLRWVGRELTAHLRQNGIGSLEEAFGVSGGAEYLEG